MVVLSVCDVSKSYGNVRALNGVALEIGRGEVVALLGRNGAGKTTLLSIVAGLLTPDAGSVMVCGQNMARDRSRAQRCIGFAPQETGVYPVLTVRENLRFFCALYAVPRRSVEERIRETCEALSLSHLLNRPARALSGGERQRLHVAACLLSDSTLVLLDEPTAGVDVQSRMAILNVVRDLAREGVAVLYSTHYLTEVETLNARTAVIHEGQIIAQGSLEELVDRHGDTALELEFTDTPPQLPDTWNPCVDGRMVRIASVNPERDILNVLRHLNGHNGLLGVRISRPTLDQVFLSLTHEPSATDPRMATSELEE